jgi:hypothetical protein
LLSGSDIENLYSGYGRASLGTVEHAFGREIDYAQLVKMYGQEPESEKRYSPAKCIGAEKHVVQGNPDISKVSTSYVDPHFPYQTET